MPAECGSHCQSLPPVALYNALRALYSVLEIEPMQVVLVVFFIAMHTLDKYTHHKINIDCHANLTNLKKIGLDIGAKKLGTLPISVHGHWNGYRLCYSNKFQCVNPNLSLWTCMSIELELE